MPPRRIRDLIDARSQNYFRANKRGTAPADERDCVNNSRPDTGTQDVAQLALLLACFDGRKTAAKARHNLDTQLQAQGDELLDTVVVEVDEKHKATTYDPRKLLWGTVSA